MNVHQVSSTNQSPITVTDRAIAHFKKQISKKDGAYGIRLDVIQSGCSGYRYDITLVDKEHPITKTESICSIPWNESDDLLCCMPKKIIPLIMGMTIDYTQKSQKGLGGEVVFINPQQTGACGCGESVTFSLPEGTK